ncbi:MAG TPA: phosphate acyltransferase [Anaerolineae bacterium]|nr:phosphate acyltransferase [Anaerolineae bacterium]
MITDFEQLVERAASRGPRRAIVLLPDTPDSLRGALLAQERGVARCTLIGQVGHIQALASQAEVDLSPLTLIDAPDRESAARQAFHLCRKQQAAVLAKDGMDIQTFLSAVLDREQGLRTGQLLSGVSVFDLQEPEKLLLVTDGIMVVSPHLDERIAMIENAVAVAHQLEVGLPRVALVAATETVNPKSQFSVDAAQITVMARRKQIVGAIVDGPLGFDNAVSAHAAEVKGIVSEVSGQVDILVAPDLEAGNLLIATLGTLCRLPALHLLVGGQVPVLLCSAGDDATTWLAGLALAMQCS